VIFENLFSELEGVYVKLYIDMSDKCNFSGKNNDLNRITLNVNRLRHLKRSRSEAMKIDSI